MWICQNNSFLSIIASDRDESVLVVRARRRGDIEAVFGEHVEDLQVTTLPGRDYQFRAFIPRNIVGTVIALALVNTKYTNFKDSTKDRHLHDAYMDIWHVMAELQEIPPYRTTPRPGFRKQPIRPVAVVAATPELSVGTKALFVALVKDAGNWSGVPLFGGNVGNSAADKGHLTDLKRKGLVTTEQDSDNKRCHWVNFTDAGKQYAASLDLANHLS
jgi:hypothetical protein